MKSNYFLFFALWSSIFLVQCKSSQNTSEKQDALEGLISNEIGQEVDQSYNADKTRVLAIGEIKNGEKANDSARIPKKYIVIDVEAKSILYQGNIEAGYAKWLDNDNIEVFSPLGIMLENQNKDDLIQVINVVSGEKTTMTLYKAKKS